jgi:quercetin dioxygenase-like cupin family protein
MVLTAPAPAGQACNTVKYRRGLQRVFHAVFRIDFGGRAPALGPPQPTMSSPLLLRRRQEGLKLDVAGLNEITVLVDRSETELTEVAMNAWHPGLDGPPHAHAGKEQNFLVTSGRGRVKVGTKEFEAAPGRFFYLPAGVVHQTITAGEAPLVYFLFNAFLDAGKEGHASFADHIAQVKETRRRQAETQRADADPALAAEGTGSSKKREGASVDTAGLRAPSTVLLSRRDSARCEAVHHWLPADAAPAPTSDATKEQTVYVMSGDGEARIGAGWGTLAGGDVLFVPRGERLELRAGSSGLEVVSFGTVVEV